MGPRLCPAVAWAAWTIKPTFNRNDEGPGFLPGLLSFAEATVDNVSVGGAFYHGHRSWSKEPSDKSALGKTMSSDDKKTKTNPVPKNEVAPKKKDEAAPKNKSTSGADLSKTEGGEIAENHPQAIAGVRARNRFLKHIRITGTRFTRKRRSDNPSKTSHTR